MTRHQQMRGVALLAGALLLAGPRRTRGLAGFVYGVALSRAQGESHQTIERTILRLFDERGSAFEAIIRTREGQRINAEHFDRRLDQVQADLAALEDKVEQIERAATNPRPGFIGG